ncbi:MAG: CinA family nicotinamide mononucleotide deamidase-related protein [Muribaculaceae bacterium]|nr:CinA family nicotinamide mononucleotide deamidase-related protein [Muribaculaceae bacterium]
MKLSIIIIGDEILIGQVTDTNSGAIARTFGPLGWDIAGVRTVPDDAAAIRHAVTAALSEAHLVVCTGGLGPTKDDITKHTLAEIFGGPMRRDPEVTANIERVFALRGLAMNELTAAQADVPASCRVIQNRFGTAPVMWFERDGRVVISMPGVPFETEGMLPEVAACVARRFHSDTVLRHRCLMVGGISESALAGRLAPWESALPPHMHLAYLPAPGLIRLRLDGRGVDAEVLDAEMQRQIDSAKAIIGPELRYEGDATAAEIALDYCRRHAYTLGTAESCTGGTIAQRITAIAGCSDVFLGSVVSYANSVKTGLLGVDNATLDACGAVSREVVEQMADGARRALGCDCAIATSGIAGPGGATPDKPVGTVWIACATPSATVSRLLRLPGNRARVIDRAATEALLLLSGQVAH